MLLLFEIFAVITGFLFLVLLIRQNIFCWLFGILSSAASVFLFYQTKLYSESILYIFYILIGIYGWWVWSRTEGGEKKQVRTAGWMSHVCYVVTGIVGATLLGLFFKTNTDAQRPFADAGSTVFSFIASYMEAHKILSTWFFWIIINAFSVWLYLDRGLKFYSLLMVVYFLLSVYGYISWKKSLIHQT